MKSVKIQLTGEALQLFDDFIKYGHSNTAKLADAMYYCYDGFVERLAFLEKAYDKGMK